MPSPEEARASIIEQITAGDFDDVELVDVEDPHDAGQVNPDHGSNTTEEMSV